MMRVLKVLILSILFVLFSVKSYSQSSRGEAPEKDPKQAVDEFIEKYSDELRLDDLQAALLKVKFFEFYEKQQMVIRGEGSRDQKVERIKVLHESLMKGLAEFLDKGQIKALKKAQEKERKRRMGRRRG